MATISKLGQDNQIKDGYKMIRGTSTIIPVTCRTIENDEWEEIVREATRSGHNIQTLLVR